MAKIRKAMPFGSARGQRQNRVKSVERLDSALLIDTEDRSVYRWLEIEANDFCRLFFKLRVIARHLTTQSMRLNAEMAPDTAHAGLANAQHFGQPIAAPVSRTVRGTLARELQNTRLGLRCSAWTSAITRIRFLLFFHKLPAQLRAGPQALFVSGALGGTGQNVSAREM
jgi:hypothetical protein